MPWMEITKTGFEGLLVIKPKVFSDKRGYFFESFNQLQFEKNTLSFFPVQDNESKSSKGVIRGLHYQLKPHQQAKLVRVIEGKIFDVALDLRKDSQTFGKWYGIELDSEEKFQLFIPGGFAHGYSVISETAIIQYKVDNYYDMNLERGINIMDPELGISWPTGSATPLISEKDIKSPYFSKAEFNF
jgi:dTDP-4-dehydrorhamnose 3,5-epimerase